MARGKSCHSCSSCSTSLSSFAVYLTTRQASKQASKQAITDCTHPFPYQIFCCHPPFNPSSSSIHASPSPSSHPLPPLLSFPIPTLPPSRTRPKRNQEKRTERQPKPQTQNHKLAVPPQRPPGKSHQKKRGRPAHTHRNRRSLITAG